MTHEPKCPIPREPKSPCDREHKSPLAHEPKSIWAQSARVVLGYRKLSLSIIDNFAIFLIIKLSIIWA
jgi:hypothetical protein